MAMMLDNVKELWAGLSVKLFPQEFVIDEAPFEIFEQFEAVTGKGEGSSDTKAVDADLRAQVCSLMVEQDRLTQLARHLEQNQGSGGEDEFSKFVKQALPFLDNFQRLLDLGRENTPTEELDNWLKSFETLYFRIVRILENYGLRFINSVGKEVDFEYQDVVEYRPTKDFPHNTVMREIQKGAVFRGRLLRDARVVVACNES